MPSVVATVVSAANRGLVGACLAVAAVAFAWLAKVINTPSRIYDRAENTVGREYDAWTSEGILEYYWGEHIHLGYYGEKERKGPFYGGKDFIGASTSTWGTTGRRSARAPSTAARTSSAPSTTSSTACSTSRRRRRRRRCSTSAAASAARRATLRRSTPTRR